MFGEYSMKSVYVRKGNTGMKLKLINKTVFPHKLVNKGMNSCETNIENTSFVFQIFNSIFQLLKHHLLAKIFIYI